MTYEEKLQLLLEKVIQIPEENRGIIAFSDFHAELFAEFAQPTDKDTISTRFRDQLFTLEAILETAERTNQSVLFAGDLFHRRGSVLTSVFNRIFQVFRKHTSTQVLLLRGNHDSVDNTLESDHSLEQFKVLPNVTVVDTPQHLKFNGYTITALPYGNDIARMKSFLNESQGSDILTAHIGLSGAQESSGHSLEGAFTITDLHMERYNYGMLGHYHKRQEMGNNCHYIGNTIPNNFADTEEKGILVFNPKVKLPPRFVPIKNPIFTTVNIDDHQPENIQQVMEDNFVRLRGDKETISQLVALDNVPTNIRTEVQVNLDVESRIGIKASDSPDRIVSEYCKKYMPESEKQVVRYITMAMKEGE